MGQRLSLRALRYGSLLLAVLGLAVLFLVAARSQVPTRPIAALGDTLNWAYLRVEGIVSRQPAFDADTGSFKFWLRDESGEIMVIVYRGAAVQLQAAGTLPEMGDEVSVAGTLRVREDFSYIVLDIPDQLVLQRAEVVDVQVGEVNTGFLLQRVRLRGQVRDTRTPYEGLDILTLADATGQIEVLLPREIAFPSSQIAAGRSVEVVGVVDHYRGAPQISVGYRSDVRLLEEDVDAAPLRSVAGLSPGDVGRMVAIEAAVDEVQPFSAGVKVRLSEAQDRVVLLLWRDVYDGLTWRESLVPGARVRAQGEIAEYRGELEIVPGLPSDLQLRATPPPTPSPTATLSPLDTPTPPPTPQRGGASTREPTPQPTALPTALPTGQAATPPAILPTAQPTFPPTPAARSLGSVTLDDVGADIVVEAGIADVDYFSKGIKYTLTDPTGALTLLVWQDVLEEVADRLDLLPGSRVRVAGYVDAYGGELEIVPHSGQDVRVVSRGDRLPVEERLLVRITPSDEGRVFIVSGVVTHVEGDGWLKLLLRDDTGEIEIYLPERLVPYLPVGIGPGVRLRIAGEVDVYRGAVEIIPLAGADVEVRP
jgi:DNA/RNA endonuclease YhcR with UshA esterase domain